MNEKNLYKAVGSVMVLCNWSSKRPKLKWSRKDGLFFREEHHKLSGKG